MKVSKFEMNLEIQEACRFLWTYVSAPAVVQTL